MTKAQKRIRFKDIVSQLKKGKKRILNEIFKEHRNMFIYTLMKNHEVDEDAATILFTDSLLILQKNAIENRIKTFEASVETYLIGIGSNLFINKKRGFVKTIGISNEIDEELVEERLKQEEIEELIKIIDSNIDKLDEKCRKLIKYVFHDGLKAEEITELLEIKSIGAFYVQKLRCLKVLRELVFANLIES